jgi:hypothetical protein
MWGIRRAVSCAALVVLACACPGARYAGSIKSTTGAAMTPPGVSSGTTNIVRLADVGGPLARAGLFGMALVAASGAVKTHTTTTTHREGDYIVTTETTRVTGIDEQQMANAQAMLDAATGEQPLGIQASLEVASRTFGGDTSGWMYNLGYGGKAFLCGPALVCYLYGGLGFGRYTFHDRTIRAVTYDGISETTGDVDFTYFGTPLRLTVAPTPYASVYVQADVNWLTVIDTLSGEQGSPSPWHLGVELRGGLAFVRVELAASRMTRAGSSWQVEVGLGF